MKNVLLSSSAIVLALALAGCATPVPQQLSAANVPSNFSAPITADAPIWPKADWWKGFQSDELNSLVDEAQRDNLDLAVAAAQVMEAKANAEIAGSVLWPQIGISGDAERAKSGIGAPGGRSTSNNFSLTGNASWALDIWGKGQAGLRSADEAVKSSRFAKQAVALTVISSTGSTYFNVLALRERVAIAQSNIEAAKRVLSITQAKVTNGVSSRLDLAQQQAQVSGQEAQIPPLHEAEREARYALAILLGKLPEGFDVQGQNLDKIVAPAVRPGLPSELLRRRPDVAQAEANLAAAHANVDAARAAFFPAIGLTGSGGFASGAIGSLIKSSNFGWSIGASLLQTIFDGGNLMGQYRVSKARQLQLVATYRKTVLTAFQDVETSLGQVASLTQQEKLLTDEVNAASEAFRISEIQYREGVTDLLTVLTAQQTLFNAQDQLVQIKLARIQADVGLYRALGGGWSEADELATQAMPAATAPVAPSAEPGPQTVPAAGIPTTPGPSQIPDEPIPLQQQTRKPRG
ncbi:MAG: efflux transporter outer membrane subunit [Proteobacteria bacterium]|nr:efflux transporter outer membrane subunit [Pseudomonadota bacterium]